MRYLILFGLLGISNLSGCALCCSPFDGDYVTYGTRDPRLNMKYGRSGSPFSDPAYASPVVEGYHEEVEYAESYSEDYEHLQEPLVDDEVYFEDVPETGLNIGH